MGLIISKNQLRKALEQDFHVKQVSTMYDDGRSFTSTSKIEIVKNKGMCGILIDDKHWYCENISVLFHSPFGKHVIPIKNLDKPFIYSGTGTKEDHKVKCSLLFKFNWGFFECEYTCHLQDRPFTYCVTMIPTIEKMFSI